MPRCLPLLFALAAILLSACQATTSDGRSAALDNGAPIPAAAPETIEQRALRTKVELGGRVHRVAAPLLQAMAPECPGATVRHDGWLGVSRTAFGESVADDTGSAFALQGHQLKVVSLVAGMPAANEGMEAGDVIAAINGRTLPDDPQARIIARRTIDAAGDNEYELIRGSLRLRGTVTPATLCAIPIFISDQDSQNILNDGTSILVDRGLLGLMVEDRDLAALLAHEMAHVLMGTRGRASPALDMTDLFSPVITARTAWGGLAQPVQDPLTTPFDTTQLLAADRAALLLMERAGVNTNGYEALWRRLAADGADVTRLRPVTRGRLAGIGIVRSELADEAIAGGPRPLLGLPPG